MVPARRLLVALCALAIAGFGPSVPARAQGSQDLTIFAAASLRNALDEVAKAWTAAGRPAPRISYAGSNALARQIDQGAPADVFLSADLAWMDHLSKGGHIVEETRTNLLANRIALIAPKDTPVALTLSPGADLPGALGNGRLAMANVDAVPAGRYGKAALEKLGLWAGVSARVAQAENVRAALLLVSRGEAPLGIVYTTDAISEPGVRVVATFPEDTHPPIVYPVAAVKTSRNPDTAAFLAHLSGPASAAIFQKHGFTTFARPAKGS